jgi:hypothetical protein
MMNHSFIVSLLAAIQFEITRSGFESMPISDRKNDLAKAHEHVVAARLLLERLDAECG